MKKYSIGVAGYAGAGKDTVVERLATEHGFGRVAFADPLRQFTWAVNPIVAVQPNWADRTFDNIRYQDALNEVGYNEAKFKYPEVREILQRIGTEGARETFWDSFWVDIALRRAEELGGRVAFSDCRFPNEATACDLVVWVSRAGYAPVNAHISDNALAEWDFDVVLTNDGTYDELYEQVDDMVTRFDDDWSDGRERWTSD